MAPVVRTVAAPRVLVIGYGFIGGAVVRALVQRGRRVTVLTSRADATLARDGVDRVVGQADDVAVLTRALEGASAAVFCTGPALPAALEVDGGTKARMDRMLAVTIAACSSSRTSLFFLSSGGTVYGEPDVEPVPESCPLRPLHAYGRAKARAEKLLAAARRESGMCAVALRCANPYGPGQRPWRSQGVVATLFAAATSGRPVPLYGDGLAVRDYIHVDDVAGAITDLLALDDVPPAVNIGTGVGTRLIDLVREVELACGHPITLERRPARPTDLRRVVLDTTLLRSLVPFRPMGLAEGLATAGPLRLAAITSS